MKHLLLGLSLLGCAASTAPTVRVTDADAVADMQLSEACDADTLVDWIALDAAWLESPTSLLVRARQCPGSELSACGAIAPEDIDPGWFNVTVGGRGATGCDAPVERVLRIDLSSNGEHGPELDRVDQRAVRPSATEGVGPQVVPIWLRGDMD